MNCLNIEQIYLYLEKELLPWESKKIEEHLASCLKCQNALEERRFLLEAAERLSPYEVPPDFPQIVMARIYPAKTRLVGWLIALASGFSSLVLALIIMLEAKKQNFLDLLISLNRSLWNLAKNAALIFVKLFKFLSLAVKIFREFFGEIFEISSKLIAAVSPEIQIILISITLIMVFFLIFGVRRKFLTGEKS